MTIAPDRDFCAPVWQLASRGRPKLAQAAIEACEAHGMTSCAELVVDGNPDGYDFTLPSNWVKIELKAEKNIVWAKNDLLRRAPAAKCYGWLADDTYPETDGWCQIVEQAAGKMNLAYCYDSWIMRPEDQQPIEWETRFNESSRQAVVNGENLTSGLCWGGELVRAVGWWGLPGNKQACSDVAWCDLIRGKNLHRYLPHVTVRHDNYRTNNRPVDDTDSWVRDGQNYIQQDIDRWTAWRESGAMDADRAKIDAVLRRYADKAAPAGEIDSCGRLMLPTEMVPPDRSAHVGKS